MSADSATIRLARPEDIHLLELCLPEGDVRKHGIRLRWQARDAGRYFIAWDGPPMGHVWLGWRARGHHPAAAGYADLEDLFVDPGWRGHGIGARILAAAEEAARARGLIGLGLSLDAANGAAKRFYARAGYREAGGGPRSLNLRLRDGHGGWRAWRGECEYWRKELGTP